MAGRQQIGVPELSAQVVALTDQVNAAHDRMAIQADRIAALENQGSSGGGDSKRTKGGIFGHRMMEPEKMNRVADFKEWVED